jgi:aldose 1-epimerase
MLGEVVSGRGTIIIAAMAAGAFAAGSPARAVTVQRAPFGTMPDGTRIEAVTLSNGHGVSARIISFGATLQSLKAPDRNGQSADIELGYDDLDSYVNKPNYWGASIGRYANRIAGGRFTLDGRSYQLAVNDKTNSLHGGDGFDKRVWHIVSVDQSGSVTLEIDSPDGDQGYPGALRARVTYTLTEANELKIDFDAETTAPTVVNMTNHGIFNLAGEGTPGGILQHRLTIPASHYTPVNATLIPTGELKPVQGTVFDFSHGRVIADGFRDGRDPQIVAGRGYDHNFALDAGLTKTPKLAARLEDPASGRVLEVLTTEPGVQVYTGNFLDGTFIGKSGHLYRMGDGIALEPQKFPDSPNHPAFASARVDPGKPYHHSMIFRLSVLR